METKAQKIESLLYRVILLKALIASFLCTHQERRLHKMALEETYIELSFLGYDGSYP